MLENRTTGGPPFAWGPSKPRRLDTTIAWGLIRLHPFILDKSDGAYWVRVDLLPDPFALPLGPAPQHADLGQPRIRGQMGAERRRRAPDVLHRLDRPGGVGKYRIDGKRAVVGPRVALVRA